MSDKDFYTMDDVEFESILRESLDVLPPDDIVNDVTPWQEDIARILTGFALNAITLNFLGLNYLLPAIGMLLTLVGFRVLRRENKWFRTCWILTVIRAAYFFPALILNTTIYHGVIFDSAFGSVISFLNLAVFFILLFCFWKALREVQIKAGLQPGAGGVIAMVVWYAIVCVLAFLELGGTFFGIFMIVGYICIIRVLYETSKELDTAGYVIRPANLKHPNSTLVSGIGLIMLIGCLCGYLFFNSYLMDWHPAEQSQSLEVDEVKAHLIGMGFPETILEDLTDEDILECRDALDVVMNVQDHPVNAGRQVTEIDGNAIHIYTVYDVKELRLTGIAVKLPGEREQWKIFHHFLWTVDPGFYGTECIHLWPAYRNNDGWCSSGELTGQVLYNDADTVYAAPYHLLGTETYTSSSIFWGEQTSSDVFATFSMPNSGAAHRGYVSYTVAEMQDGWILNAWINYTHQTSPLQYPALSAQDKVMTYGVRDTNAFNTIQDALQFFPGEEETEQID